MLQALAKAGNALLKAEPKQWKGRLRQLQEIDWSRRNVAEWEGRALLGGKVSKASGNVILTANRIKQALGLPVEGTDLKAEEAYQHAKSSS